MAQLDDPALWLRQAEVDLGAARVEHQDVRECHRRYWVQQSYEKTLKALALIKYRGPARDKLFTMLSHSPLKKLGSGPLSKELHVLRRELEAFVRSKSPSNATMLLKIDGTETSTDPGQMSYRYPFLDGSTAIAPADYDDDGWQRHLGNRAGSIAAVERLLRAIRDELRTLRRAPH